MTETDHTTVVSKMDDESAGGCPMGDQFKHPTEGGGNQDWWPNQLNLKILRKHPAVANPMGEEFDYAAEFTRLDLDAVIADRRGHDDVAGLVARGLRPLRRLLRSHGLA